MVTAGSSELDSIVGRKNVVRGKSAAAYAVDGMAPNAMVRPGTYEEAAQTLRYAASEGLAVIPRGGGTMMGRANVPSRYDICLDLSRLNAIIEHEPADLTVTCQAGIALADLAKHMTAAGQEVPFDSALAGDATVGGVLATGAYGPARLSVGAPRDFTIGMRVITADGKVTRAGGKVVKNVAGYDLCKLYTGSFGTLGVIVEATFKVLPLPKAQRVLPLGFQSAAYACAFAAHAYRRGWSLRAATVLNPAAVGKGDLYLLVLDLAGSEHAVERSAREVTEFALAADGLLLDERQLRVKEPSAPLVLRAATRPTELPSLIAAVESIDDRAACSSYPTLGVLRIATGAASVATVGRCAEAMRRLGGTVVVEACPVEMKGRIDVFGDVPAAFALMRSIKQQFDPKNILSPGRFAGRL